MGRRIKSSSLSYRRCGVSHSELRREASSVRRCCGTCVHYKRDYKCTLTPDAYITSTSELTECRDWHWVGYRFHRGF